MESRKEGRSRGAGERQGRKKGGEEVEGEGK